MLSTLWVSMAANVVGLTAFTTVIVVIAAWEVIEKKCCAIYGRILDSVWFDDWRVLCHRWFTVLRILRSDFDPDVYHRGVFGWSKLCLCGVQVFLVHLAVFFVDLGRDHLFVFEIR